MNWKSSDSRPSPIAAEEYREVYGARRIDSRMVEEVCASCAEAWAIRIPHAGR